jgi:putative FmdB family regulatory protein
MPIYEYVCRECETKFAKLRPLGKADAPIVCAGCGSSATTRALSLFAAVSRGSNGEARSISGTGGGCGSCAGTHCATCSH